MLALLMLLACLDCHDVDQQKFKASVHAGLECTSCHDEAVFQSDPHKLLPKEKRQKQDCTGCHTDNSGKFPMARIDHEVKASMHARKVDENFSCNNCHNAHEFRPVSQMGTVADAVRIGNSSCLNCHEMKKLAPQHTWIPMWEMHTRAARCVDCHTAAREESIHLVMSKASAQRDCVNCHSQNSLLLNKLYRHMAKEERSSGFVNAVILNNTYMIGATKHEGLDNASRILFGIVLAGILTHAGLRRFASSRRSA